MRRRTASRLLLCCRRMNRRRIGGERGFRGRFTGDAEEEVLFCNVVILGAVIRFDCLPLLGFG
jgi:hypothetical protein